MEQVDLNVSVHLYASTGECIFNLGNKPTQFNSGIVSTEIQVPGNYLNDGSYFLSIMVVKNSSIVLVNRKPFELPILMIDTSITWFFYVITKLLQIIQFTKFGYKLWMVSANDLGLGEGGDFYHKCWCGEPNFD